jgi:hypothetical protein
MEDSGKQEKTASAIDGKGRRGAIGIVAGVQHLQSRFLANAFRIHIGFVAKKEKGKDM